MSAIITWVAANWVTIVAAYGGIMMAARVIVKLTPTPNDDTWLESVITALKHLGLHVEDSKKN